MAEQHDYAREGLPTGEVYEPTPEEQRARSKRNVAVALGVVGFCVLVFAITVLRLAQSIEAGRLAGQ
ncbi:protoheme IX farnesyltransferase [Parvularcula dongshanensis]|uniref:Uncharacterized protein n=1 Tax=Parvularcula dongshanensis TaxID=1173995 RepID=A0A840I135_9PROT|nr:protoheme IX farnesyltransferase [Parvularcula dongshanensis]MBB4658539.1 hypothetical protein [Parvularcula dongshanensis]